MLRFYYLIFRSFFLIFYYVPKMEYYAVHREKYGEERCYALALKVLKMIDRIARIRLQTVGMERLPKNGGYLMYANHQGRYDALGILQGHPLPASILIDKKRSRMLILNQFMDLINGIRINREDIRSQVECIQEMIKRVQSGERILVFPEGQYTDNGNHLQEFHAGSFKVAKRAKAPIVPVVVYDSYRAFTENTLKKCDVYVEYLNPISYEVFKNKNTTEIADMVRGLIESRIAELEEARKSA